MSTTYNLHIYKEISLASTRTKMAFSSTSRIDTKSASGSGR